VTGRLGPASPEGRPEASHGDAEENKKAAMAFYDVMLNHCRPAEAMEWYAGTRTSSTTRNVGDGDNGKQAFIDYVDEIAAQYPREFVSSSSGRSQKGDFVVLDCL
jgi:predicted SnoaL-like aldol condensation-catalyzing enzyme